MIYVVLGKYFRSFFIFLSSFILVKYLSVDHFAEYVFFNTFLLFLIALLIGPSPTLFTKYFSNHDYNFRDIFRIGIKYWFSISLIGVLIFHFFVNHTENPISSWDTRLVLLGSLIFIINTASNLSDTIFRANKSFKISEGANILESIVWFSGLAALFYYNFSAVKYIIALYLLRMISILIVHLFNLKSQAFNSVSNPKKINFLNDYSSLYLYRFFGFIIMKSNILMLGFISTSSQVAYYGFAFIFYQIITILPAAISWYLLSRTNDKSFFNGKNYIKISSITLFICVIQCVLFYIFAPQLAYFIKGDEYAGAINVIRILTIGSLFQAPQFLLSAFWIFKEKYKSLSNILTTIGLFNIALNFILIPLYGAIGASIALLLSYLIITLIQLIMLYTIKDKNFTIFSLFSPKFSYLIDTYHLIYNELKTKNNNT